jgi:hypothetical protein
MESVAVAAAVGLKNLPQILFAVPIPARVRVDVAEMAAIVPPGI